MVAGSRTLTSPAPTGSSRRRPSRSTGEAHTPTGKLPYPVPHALTTEEVRATLADIVAAAKRAVAAGLDGVEIHGATATCCTSSSRRTPTSAPTPTAAPRRTAPAPSSRSTTAIAAAVGAGKVGIRISPMHHVQGMHEVDEADVRATYGTWSTPCARWAWPTCRVLHADPAGELVQELRERFGGPLIANSGFGPVTTREEAVQLIDSAHADAVAVGRAVIANPDLVERWAGQHPENEPTRRRSTPPAPRATPTTRCWRSATLTPRWSTRARQLPAAGPSWSAAVRCM